MKINIKDILTHINVWLHEESHKDDFKQIRNNWVYITFNNKLYGFPLF